MIVPEPGALVETPRATESGADARCVKSAGKTSARSEADPRAELERPGVAHQVVRAGDRRARRRGAPRRRRRRRARRVPAPPPRRCRRDRTRSGGAPGGGRRRPQEVRRREPASAPGDVPAALNHSAPRRRSADRTPTRCRCWRLSVACVSTARPSASSRRAPEPRARFAGRPLLKRAAAERRRDPVTERAEEPPAGARGRRRTATTVRTSAARTPRARRRTRRCPVVATERAGAAGATRGRRRDGDLPPPRLGADRRRQHRAQLERDRAIELGAAERRAVDDAHLEPPVHVDCDEGGRLAVGRRLAPEPEARAVRPHRRAGRRVPSSGARGGRGGEIVRPPCASRGSDRACRPRPLRAAPRRRSRRRRMGRATDRTGAPDGGGAPAPVAPRAT